MKVILLKDIPNFYVYMHNKIEHLGGEINHNNKSIDGTKNALLEFYLISNYSLIGLAYSNLAALTLYNTVRFLFLYKRFKLQPYTLQHGLFLIISLALMFLIYIIPSTSNFVLNIAIKSSIYGLGFYALIIWINPAPELKDLVQGFLKNKLFGFLRR